MSQVLRQGSNASDAVLFVHRILRVLADLASAPRNDALIGRASFRHGPILLIQDRVVLGFDRLRLTIARRR
ncbi:MAG: hypothetical protein LC647_15840 [Beggiatoa sp.]|nr:hypothetical protein [Beggiatoa sp.]